MGLDISSFAGLSPAPDAELDEDGYPLDQDKFMYLDPELIKWTGEFSRTNSGNQTRHLHIRTFSGVSSRVLRWLQRLARSPCKNGCRHERRKNLGERMERPFCGLINFPDNEGVIGPVVAAKLAKDFAEFEHRAEEYSASIPDGTDWLENYREWKCAFEMAAKDAAGKATVA